jgi:TRAP-type C4-dicarboxylate transport system substrate-binding protein
MIRIGGYQSSASIHTRAMYVAVDAIRQGAGHPPVEFIENVASGGGKAGDLLAMVETGAMDIAYFSSSYLTDRVPALGVLDLPFKFTNRSTMLAALNGRLGEMLSDAVRAATRYDVLGFWDNGLRHISNRSHPIRSPADCAGLTIRTLDSPMHQRVFAHLGLKPTFIDAAKLKDAVASGSVDAQENPLTNIVNFDVHLHHPFVSLTGHFFGVALVLVNRSHFEAWPKELQQSVRQAVSGATTVQLRLAAEEDERCLALLVTQGVKILSTTNGLDRRAFVDAMEGLAESLTANIDSSIMIEFSKAMTTAQSPPG